MSFFDISEIEKHLLPPSRDLLFSAVGKNAPFPEVASRLKELAARWEGFVHPDFGDSYGDYDRNGNRCNFENLYIDRRRELADLTLDLAFCGGEHTERIEYLVNLICDEDTWCVPAHRNMRPTGYEGQVIELYASETAAVLSLAYRFAYGRLSDAARTLIRQRLLERIFTPYFTDHYPWMGTLGNKVANWNVWINSNIILSAALTVTNEELYKKLILRACALSENYINSIAPHFNCDEGVRYWHLAGACFYDITEMLRDLTDGKVDLTATPEIKKVCNYAATMYSESGIPANFADATAEFYPDAPLFMRAGKATDNAYLYSLGKHLVSIGHIRLLHDNFYRQIYDIITASDAYESGELPCSEPPSMPRSAFLEGIDVTVLRENGFFLAIKGGHNGEAHNHNDVGSFVLYRGVAPVFIDPGVEQYAHCSFSGDRYKLWYMRSEYHNLPTVLGLNQKPGSQYRAKMLGSDSMNIQGAYGLSDGVYNRRAEITDGSVRITDTFTYSPDGITLHYILKDKPTLENGKMIFPHGITAELENAEITDIEEIDITGENPPDGIAGDFPYRKYHEGSVLIPRLMTKQWGKDKLYRLNARAVASPVTLSVRAQEKE